MNLERTNPSQDPFGPAARGGLPLPSEVELREMCRDLEARGVKYSIVRGLPVVQQGFVRAVKGENVFEQCLEMNRQAVRRVPDTAQG